VVEEFEVDNSEDFANNFNQFPVIIKPVDNSGARGIHIVPSADDFRVAYESALTASPSKTVLVERLMNHQEITVFYLIVNGKICLLGAADRHVRKIQPDTIPLPVGYTFPSKYQSTYSVSTNEKVVSMLKSLELKNGLVFIQSFVDGEDFVFYEMGFRLTGSLEHHVYEAATGINPLKMLINFAISGEMINRMEIDDIDEKKFSGFGANLTVLLKPGKISRIVGLERLKDIEGVLDYTLSYEEGDVLSDDIVGTLQQVGLRILFHTHVPNRLNEGISSVLNFVDFVDESGNSLILN